MTAYFNIFYSCRKYLCPNYQLHTIQQIITDFVIDLYDNNDDCDVAILNNVKFWVNKWRYWVCRYPMNTVVHSKIHDALVCKHNLKQWMYISSNMNGQLWQLILSSIVSRDQWGERGEVVQLAMRQTWDWFVNGVAKTVFKIQDMPPLLSNALMWHFL